jgi:hypothetical protein
VSQSFVGAVGTRTAGFSTRLCQPPNSLLPHCSVLLYAPAPIFFLILEIKMGVSIRSGILGKTITAQL